MGTSQDKCRDLNKSLNDLLGPNGERGYSDVQVVLFYWKEGDKDFKDEAQKMEGFLRKNFGYPVSYFEIPSDEPQLRTTREITDIALRCNSRRHLTIIHYGGHGDKDANDDRRKGVWAALDQDGPTMLWSGIQPLLGNARGDILLILDCCYAAQAARSSSTVIPSNVEVLAACAMHRQTRKAGARSFTTGWMRVVKDFLDRDEPVIMSEVHKHLVHSTTDLTETAIILGRAGAKSTRLERLSQATSISFATQKAALSLQMLMRKPLSESVMRELLHWLGKCAPNDVFEINVTTLVENTADLQSFVNSEEGRGAIIQSPEAETSPTSHNEVENAWVAFISQLNTCFSKYLALPASGETTLPRDEGLNNARFRGFFQQLGEFVHDLQRKIERVILSAPSLYEATACQNQLNDPWMDRIGIAKALKVRLQTLVPPEASIFLGAKAHLQTPTGDNILGNLVFEKHSEYGAVVIEYRTFDKNDEAFNEKLVRKRMDVLASVLKAATSDDFSAPECLGCLTDRARTQYGLVFRNPCGDTEEPISLFTILSKHLEPRIDIRLPTLGQKFHLALRIGRALLKWHCVGWCHQSIASYNIFFFKDSETGDVDYAKPFLCGFDEAREDTGSSSRRPGKNELIRDVYRHAERQGWPPREKHDKKHDLYSFGLLLLEIAMWAPIAKQFNRTIQNRGRAVLGTYLLDKTKGLLSKEMGVAYEIATRMCLSGEFDVIRDDKHQSELSRVFEKEVLGRIALGTGIDGDSIDSL